MGYRISHPSVWSLVESQHGVIARRQLIELGFSARAIKHRIDNGRLHPIWPGVYAVGRKTVTFEGRWMAAVLACGPDAVLSHLSAAMLWGIVPVANGRVDVSIRTRSGRGRGLHGIKAHRRVGLRPDDFTHHRRIPITTPACTIVDIATMLGPRVERAINEADSLDIIDPEALRAELDRMPPWPGLGVVRRILDRHTFVLTRSELERLFLPIARRAGLPRPLTRCWVNGFEVDFYWPDLRLVVETNGLRYHRTAARQSRDALRGQVHAAAGLLPLSYTHAQIAFEPKWVEDNLREVVQKLRASTATSVRG
jgi:hypothetical protein